MRPSDAWLLRQVPRFPSTRLRCEVRPPRSHDPDPAAENEGPGARFPASHLRRTRRPLLVQPPELWAHPSQGPCEAAGAWSTAQGEWFLCGGCGDEQGEAPAGLIRGGWGAGPRGLGGRMGPLALRPAELGQGSPLWGDGSSHPLPRPGPWHSGRGGLGPGAQGWPWRGRAGLQSREWLWAHSDVHSHPDRPPAPPEGHR